jgi:S-formylglutathione hydrolase FrmB
MRRTGKVGDFVVLAPNGGHTFFMNSADGKIRYEDFLTKEFMPQMEKKYRVAGTRAKRGITGVSMGGFGALRLAFKYPQQFEAVSAQMPALLADIPTDFVGGGPGSPAAMLGDVFGNPIDMSFLERNSVVYFAKNDPTAELKRMKIYFNVGNNDDYGFEQGAQKLHLLLDSRGVPNEFHIYPGRHDPQFAIRHFGEVVEFQWNAMGK